MVSLRSLFRYGELAFAAYARTAAAPSLAQALRNIEFADTHALRLASEWKVVAQYEHQSEPYPIYNPETGVYAGTDSTTNGLAISVFENLSTHERILSVRGTDDPYDIATDVISVAALGSTRNQGQYQSLRTKVQEWVASGVLPAHFSVTGHSLGGFLAIGLALEFPQLVEHAYLYNAPGVGGLTGRTSIAEIARAYHISGASVDPAKFTNLRAKPGTSLVAGLGEHPSPPILVEGEDHGGWLVGTNNHSMKYLVDSLAIHDAFERLEGGASVGLASIGRIVRDTRQPSDPGVRTPSN